MHWLIPAIQAEIRPMDSVLDLCCGYGMVMTGVSCGPYVGVDIDGEQLDRWRKDRGIFIEADVTKLTVQRFDYAFNVAICIDGIEHLSKPDALALLDKMAYWAKKSIVVTPDAFFSNSHNDLTGEKRNADHRLHKSLITEDEFRGLGFTVKVKQPEVLGFNCMMYVKETR